MTNLYSVPRTKARRFDRVLADRFRRALVVEDDAWSMQHNCSVLRQVLGSGLEIVQAESLTVLIDRMAETPDLDLLLLDGVLPPSDTAMSAVPVIRRTGYCGPIIVVSSIARANRYALSQLGVLAGIDDDDFDSTNLSAILHRALGRKLS